MANIWSKIIGIPQFRGVFWLFQERHLCLYISYLLSIRTAAKRNFLYPKCNSINIYKHYYKHVWICLLWTIWNFLNHRTLPWESIGIISVVEIQQCTTHSAGGKTVAKDPFKFWALAKYRVQTFFGGLLSLLNILFSADMYGAVNLLYWGNTVKDKQVYFYTGHLPSTGNNEIYHIQSEKNHHVWKIVVITQHSLLI